MVSPPFIHPTVKCLIANIAVEWRVKLSKGAMTQHEGNALSWVILFFRGGEPRKGEVHKNYRIKPS